MSTRHYCDLCGSDVTGVESSAINAVEDADEHGDGEVTHAADHVCAECFDAWLAWMNERRTQAGIQPTPRIRKVASA